jgi:molybdopterin-dependent oxidoreductase-like protein
VAFVPISWDDALDEVAERLTRAAQHYGSETVRLAAQNGVVSETEQHSWADFGDCAIGAEGSVIVELQRLGFPIPVGQHEVIRDLESPVVRDAA